MTTNEKPPDLPRLSCPNLRTHAAHPWPRDPLATYWCVGRTVHAEAAALAEAMAAQFGASEVYPSKAAGYGVEGLMAMAGTLAERAEEAIAGTTPSQQVPAVLAAVGQVYATLAQTQAIRDLPEAAAQVVDSDTPSALDMRGLAADLRLVLPRMTEQLTLTAAERAAATRLGILAQEVDIHG